MSTKDRTEGKRVMSATDFKAKCLRVIDEIEETGESVVITKHGKPKAIVSPMQQRRRTTLGAWKGKVEILGDIVYCDWSDEWEALK